MDSNKMKAIADAIQSLLDMNHQIVANLFAKHLLEALEKNDMKTYYDIGEKVIYTANYQSQAQKKK